MSKELEAFVRLEQNSKRYKGRKQDLDIVFATLKEKENIEKTINELFSENGKVITTIDIKKQLKALEIIKELLNLKVVEFFPNDPDTRLFVSCGNFKVGISIPPQCIDLLKEVLL